MRFPSRFYPDGSAAIRLCRLRELLAEYGDDVYLFAGGQGETQDPTILVASTEGLPPGWWVPLAIVDVRAETVTPLSPELIAGCRRRSVGDAEAVLCGGMWDNAVHGGAS